MLTALDLQLGGAQAPGIGFAIASDTVQRSLSQMIARARRDGASNVNRPAQPALPPPGIRRAVVELRNVVRGASHTHRLLRGRLMILVAGTVLLDAVGTVLMYVCEHDHAASGFDDLGGAWFWVSAQLTTVSSQMPNPVTGAGRVIDIVLEVWAISAVATLAGAFGAFFVARHHETPGAPDRADAPR